MNFTWIPLELEISSSATLSGRVATAIAVGTAVSLSGATNRATTTNFGRQDTAIRAAIRASVPPPQICRQYRISPATYHRIKAASVRDEAAEESAHIIAPRPGTMQIEQLCQVFPGLPIHEQTRVAEDVRQAAQANPLFKPPSPSHQRRDRAGECLSTGSRDARQIHLTQPAPLGPRGW